MFFLLKKQLNLQPQQILTDDTIMTTLPIQKPLTLIWVGVQVEHLPPRPHPLVDFF